MYGDNDTVLNWDILHFVWGLLKGEGPFGRPKCRCEDNFVVDGAAATWKDAERIYPAQDKNDWLFCTRLHKTRRGGFLVSLATVSFPVQWWQ